MTAFIEAAKNNQFGVLQSLALSGADINGPTNEHVTALMFASAHGHPEIVRFLVGQDIQSMPATRQERLLS